MEAIRIISKSTNIDDLQEYIAELSSVVRDKSPRSANKLWKRLLTESVCPTHEDADRSRSCPRL